MAGAVFAGAVPCVLPNVIRAGCLTNDVGMGRATKGAIIEKVSAMIKRIRFTSTPVLVSINSNDRSPPLAVEDHFQSRPSRPLQDLTIKKAIYHKDSASENAPLCCFAYGPVMVRVCAGFSFNGKPFDVE